jgi:Ca2+:H+ antiporter
MCETAAVPETEADVSGHRIAPAHYAFPVLALGLALALIVWPDLAPEHHGPAATALSLLATVLLTGAAFATVSHSDVVAARLGQPFGTLVLTLSVTVIEVSVIASMMVYQENNPTLARESVLSVIMIVTSGIVGLCLLLGGFKHREQQIAQQGVTGYLSVIIALGVMLLVLPNETHAHTRGTFTPFQLVYMGFVSIGLYGLFLYMQTVRYKEHFGAQQPGHGNEPPNARRFTLALVMLLLSLGAVVALARHVAAGVETFLGQFQLADPDAVKGALLAALVLMPEGISAVRAAARNHLQHSLNIALGSVLATIALTIPAMAAISIYIGKPMVLGLDPEDRTLMVLTFVLCILSFGTGRTNALTGIVHLIVFVVYVMLLFVP